MASLPNKQITADALRPEHLDELTALARDCLEAVWSVYYSVCGRPAAEVLKSQRARGACHIGGIADAGNDWKEWMADQEDWCRWWIQSQLVIAMNAALRAWKFLNAGLHSEIVSVYPAGQMFSAGDLSRPTAHALAVHLAFDLLVRAWRPIYVAEGLNFGVTVIYSFPGPFVRMSDQEPFVRVAATKRSSKTESPPLFKVAHLPAIAESVRGYPDIDLGAIEQRLLWENSQVKDRRRAPAWEARETRPVDGPWSNPIPKQELRDAIGRISLSAFRKRLTTSREPVDGLIRYRGPKNARRIEVAIDDLPALAKQKLARFLPKEADQVTLSSPK
ncbi:MAG: hypothetical protein WCB27_16360 [Thermoguttaceae bacterium]